MRGNIDYQVARAAAEILNRKVTGSTRLGRHWREIVERAGQYMGLVPAGYHGGTRATVSSLIRAFNWSRTTSDWKKGHFRGKVGPKAGAELFVGREVEVAPGVTITTMKRVNR